MECIAVFLGWTALVAVFLLAGGQAQGERRRVETALGAAAFRRQGRLRRGSWSRPPRIEFPYRGRPAVIEAIRGRGRWELQASLPLPGATAPCLLTARDAIAALFSTGAHAPSEFDRWHSIQASDRAASERLLSDGVRMEINRLRLSGDCKEVMVSAGGERLTVVKPLRRPSTAAVEEAVHLIVELYEQALLAQSSAIEFADSRQRISFVEAQCRVCGEALSGEIVLCRSCSTPHHYDCWRFVGQCSVFGCQQDQCISVPVARVVGPERSCRKSQS